MTSATDSVASDRPADTLGSPGKTYTFLVVALATFLAGLAIWQIPSFAVVSQVALEFQAASASTAGGEETQVTSAAPLPTHEELAAQFLAESQLREAIQRNQKTGPLDDARLAELVQDLRQRVRIVPAKGSAAGAVELRVEYMGSNKSDAIATLKSLSEQSLAALHGRPLDSRLQAEYVRAMEKEQNARRNEEQAFRAHEKFLAQHFTELKKLDPSQPKSPHLVERKPAEKKEEPSKPAPIAKREEKAPAKKGSSTPAIHVSGPTGPRMISNPHMPPAAAATAPTQPAAPAATATPHPPAPATEAPSVSTAAQPEWAPPLPLAPENKEAAIAPIVAPTAPPVAAPVTPAPVAPAAPVAPPEVAPTAANPPAAPDTSAIEQTIRTLEARIADLRKQQEALAAKRSWVDPDVRAMTDVMLLLQKQLRDARDSLVAPPLPAAPPPSAAPPQSSGPAVRPSRVSQNELKYLLAPATTAPVVDPQDGGSDQAGPLEILRREAESLGKSHEEMRRRWKLAVDEKMRISRALEDGPRLVARISDLPHIETQLGGPAARSRLLWITLLSLVVGACTASYAGNGEEASRLQSKDETESWLRLPIWGELHFGERPTTGTPAPLWVWMGVRGSEVILMAVVVVLVMALCLQSSFAQLLLKDPLAAYSDAVSLLLGSRGGS